jgi:hypothetical protein
VQATKRTLATLHGFHKKVTKGLRIDGFREVFSNRDAIARFREAQTSQHC